MESGFTPPIPEHRLTEESSADVIPDDGSIIGRLATVDSDLRDRYFTRPVTTFIDKDGLRHDAAANQIEVINQDPANVEVKLKSHNEKIIVMTAAGILLAIQLIRLQRNRSQRKKMTKQASSYRRSPKK